MYFIIYTTEKMKIAVDLDGTLIEYTVWKGREHLGKALPGAHNAILKLFQEKHELILFTTRLNPGMCAKDGVSLKDEKKRIEEHLKAEGLGFFTELTGSKPLAEVYIDDRAVRHYDWKETLHELEAIQAKQEP